MAENQRAQVSGTNDHQQDSSIVVKELAGYPWPSTLTERRYGKANPEYRWQFESLLGIIRIMRNQYDWRYFYSDPDSGFNRIGEHQPLIDQLERLFQDELGTKFSSEQRQLLLRSEVVVVAISRETNSIAGYASSTYVPGNTIPGISIPLSLGNHCVIASDHQRFKLGVLMGAISMMHGQRVRNLFGTIYCALRTNNKYIFKPMSQIGTILRSDQLDNEVLTERELNARKAIEYMHTQVFGLTKVALPFNKPLDIQHRFNPEVTIEGVGVNQIIYVFCETCPVRAIFKLMTKRTRRPRP